MVKDYCTLFPEGTWAECCKRHDRRYEKMKSKWKADRLLFRCVKRKGNIVVASIMWLGVTLFGWYNFYKAQRN